MDAYKLLARMCERHQLDADRAKDLVPLVQRALISPNEVRSRILTMIDDVLSRRSNGDATATLAALEEDLDEEVLLAVAKKVHGWDPPWRRRPFGGDDDDLGSLGGDLPSGLGGGL
ncbi:MAG: hypothetical protein AAF726_00945 [Planctomycetota bacterium]